MNLKDHFLNILNIIVRPTIDQIKFGRLIIANTAVYWFIFLIWPGQTLYRPAYAGMKAIGSDELWGIIFLILGVLQYLRLEIWVYTGRKALIIDSITAFIWTFVTISMIMSIYPPPAAIAGDISIAMIAIWVWIHARLERAEVLREFS
jgi:hypothetical protein